MIINAEEMAMEEIAELANELMAEWSSSKNKQRTFVLEYLKTNFSNASEAVRKAGYSPKYANRQATQLLNEDRYQDVQNVIIELQEAFEIRATELSVASSVEIKQYLTSVMRGQVKEQTLIGVDKGKQAITEIGSSTTDRTKAAELLGKSMKMWTDRVEHENNVPVIISGEDELED